MSDLGTLAAELRKAAAGAEAACQVALRKTAEDIVADAQALVPVDTGHLKASLAGPSFTGLTAEIGPTADYGGYVELGTSRMGPQPYLRPAFDRRVDGFMTAIEQAARGLI